MAFSCNEGAQFYDGSTPGQRAAGPLTCSLCLHHPLQPRGARSGGPDDLLIHLRPWPVCDWLRREISNSLQSFPCPCLSLTALGTSALLLELLSSSPLDLRPLRCAAGFRDCRWRRRQRQPNLLCRRPHDPVRRPVLRNAVGERNSSAASATTFTDAATAAAAAAVCRGAAAAIAAAAGLRASAVRWCQPWLPFAVLAWACQAGATRVDAARLPVWICPAGTSQRGPHIRRVLCTARGLKSLTSWQPPATALFPCAAMGGVAPARGPARHVGRHHWHLCIPRRLAIRGACLPATVRLPCILQSGTNVRNLCRVVFEARPPAVPIGLARHCECSPTCPAASLVDRSCIRRPPMSRD